MTTKERRKEVIEEAAKSFRAKLRERLIDDFSDVDDTVAEELYQELALFIIKNIQSYFRLFFPKSKAAQGRCIVSRDFKLYEVGVWTRRQMAIRTIGLSVDSLDAKNLNASAVINSVNCGLGICDITVDAPKGFRVNTDFFSDFVTALVRELQIWRREGLKNLLIKQRWTLWNPLYEYLMTQYPPDLVREVMFVTVYAGWGLYWLDEQMLDHAILRVGSKSEGADPIAQARYLSTMGLPVEDMISKVAIGQETPKDASLLEAKYRFKDKFLFLFHAESNFYQSPKITCWEVFRNKEISVLVIFPTRLKENFGFLRMEKANINRILVNQLYGVQKQHFRLGGNITSIYSHTTTSKNYPPYAYAQKQFSEKYMDALQKSIGKEI